MLVCDLFVLLTFLLTVQNTKLLTYSRWLVVYVHCAHGYYANVCYGCWLVGLLVFNGTFSTNRLYCSTGV